MKAKAEKIRSCTGLL